MWQKRRTRHMKVDSATFGDPTRHPRRFWIIFSKSLYRIH